MGMQEFPSGEDKRLTQDLIELQDGYKNAYPSQGTLEDIPEDALPDAYRDVIRIRQDRNSFFIAFSDKSQDLEPTEYGFVPNAHIKKVPVMTGPRRFGSMLKEWVDVIREEERKDSEK